MVIREVASVQEAVDLATMLKQAGTYDWFRGQICNWSLCSAFCRLADDAARSEALEKIGRFERWVKATPGLEDLAADVDGTIAVAQHYGLPTNFIDFTIEPTIAGFFASHGKPKADEYSCIICLSTDDLREFWAGLPDKYPPPEFLSMSVPNLWRLDAQYGRFLFCPYPNLESVFYDLDRIVFPCTGPIAHPNEEMVYPRRKSALEMLLDQYFMNEQLIEGTKQVLTLPMTSLDFCPPRLDRDAVRTDRIQPHETWAKHMLRAWIEPRTELWPEAATTGTRELMIDLDLGPTATREHIAGQLRDHLAVTPDGERNLVHWRLQLLDGTASQRQLEAAATIVERLWDGLRILPHADADIAEGMAVCMAVIGHVLRDPLGGMELALDAVIPDRLEVEMGSHDGSYSRAVVSRAELLRSMRDDLTMYLHDEWRDELSGNTHGLLQVIHLPQYLFDFGRLTSLFARQLAPTQVLLRGKTDAIFFSPARLETFGLP